MKNSIGRTKGCGRAHGHAHGIPRASAGATMRMVAESITESQLRSLSETDPEKIRDRRRRQISSLRAQLTQAKRDRSAPKDYKWRLKK